MIETPFIGTHAGYRLRATVAFFFILSGAYMSFTTAAFGGGFLYLGCGILWTVSGFVWLAQPSIASRISAGPVLWIAARLALASLPVLLPPYRRGLGSSPIVWFYGLQVLCVIIALALVVITIRKTSVRNATPLVISFGLVFAGFLVDKAFVDRTKVRSYSMNWTVDGTTPWGNEERDRIDKNGNPPVVIYRSYDQGYCFDEFFSPELRRRLIESHKPLVIVEYYVTSDFGKERGYNVRSVDGLIFTDGKDHSARPGEEGGGGYASVSPGPVRSGSCDHK